eukprot:m.45490 g.45490  ORF g.45490 m.45490 type:complete len:450 (+) comp10671_c0_seq2:111-1460(+)
MLRGLSGFVSKTTTGLRVGGVLSQSTRFSSTATVSSSTTLENGAEATAMPIYLDVQATTQMDPRVLDAMLPYFKEDYGNPHSRSHVYGWRARDAVEEAREHIAALIGADAREIFFTSGATEANNMAIKGIARFYQKKKTHIITSAIEHKCVLDSCRALEQEGFEVTYLPVQQNGVIDIEELKAAIRPETGLVSIMMVNNEIGTRQPVEEIGKLCKENKIVFHTDAAQAVGKIPVNVKDMNAGAMSISAHKMYGPKGMGCLYVRRIPRVRLVPLISGGGQERGLRSGTVPTPLAVGFGEAARLARVEMEENREHIEQLSRRLVDGIRSQVVDVVYNGDEENGFPGCVNLSFAYIEGESLMMALKGIAVSSGSACTSASLEPSYVLRAIGTAEDLAHSSIRFGIGKFTTEEDIEFTINKVIKEVHRLREMSPLWEMKQQGVDISKIEWTQH